LETTTNPFKTSSDLLSILAHTSAIARCTSREHLSRATPIEDHVCSRSSESVVGTRRNLERSRAGLSTRVRRLTAGGDDRASRGTCTQKIGCRELVPAVSFCECGVINVSYSGKRMGSATHSSKARRPSSSASSSASGHRSTTSRQ
jgi:hypothetical protein